MSVDYLPRVPIDYEAIIADPLFKCGYGEIFDRKESAVDRSWSDRETLAYERGRAFGEYVLHVEDERVPLSRGSLVSHNAKMMLIHAMRERWVK